MDMKDICIYISIAVLLSTTLGAIIYARLHHRNSKIKPIYILIVGVFLAIYAVLLYIDFKPKQHGNESTAFLALFHTIQVMLTGYDFEFLYESLNLRMNHANLYFLYMSFLFILGPTCTFGFVLSFFESITSYIRYLLHRNSDIYILSELSEKSLILAQSIRRIFPKSVIAFMGFSSDSEESIHTLKDSAKKIRSIFFRKGISDAGLKFHSKTSKVTFFAIGENETLNIEAALTLIDKFCTRKNTELYVFSTSTEGGLLLDSVSSGNMKLRRINEVRSLVYSLIHTSPITNEVSLRDGKKIISAMIVGFGRYGTELTKALLWCGQLPGYDLEINVVDKDTLTESRFRAECPEIMELNNNTQIGEARYELNFFNGIDIRSYQLHDTVKKLTNTSVVYVTLGNDELNIETAINLRILFERIGLYPVIRAVVYSDIKYKTLKERNLVNYRGESYDIEIIGNIENRFSYSSIIDDRLEALALDCHLRWAISPEKRESAIKQFNEYEYYRRSSTATAIHESYRARENVDEKTSVIFEHMRWNAFMRTEGYIFSKAKDNPSSRNDRAKIHHNLHSFEGLNEKDIDKDHRIACGRKSEK